MTDSPVILEGDAITGRGRSVNPFLLLDDAAGFIEFATDVFGAVENVEVRTPTPDGRLIHAELRMGDSLVMLADSLDGWPRHPGLLQVWVADVDDLIARATARGASVVTPPSPFYGSLTLARLRDPWQNLWWVYQPSPGQADPTPAWEGGSDVIFRTLDEELRSEGRSNLPDTEPQKASAKVLWHFTMTVDGFVAGPNHSMDWMTGFTGRPGIIEEYADTTGAILGGRAGWDAYPDASVTYGGIWTGATFVLTHHPEDLEPSPGVTFVNCDVAEALQMAKDAAGEKNVEVFSPTIGRQLLERGLVDEIDLHIAPVLLGDGVRLFDNPGGAPIPLRLLNGGGTDREINVRYRPLTTP